VGARKSCNFIWGGEDLKPRLKRQDSGVEELFRSKLKNIISRRHELVRLGELIDWARLEAYFVPNYRDAGRLGCRSDWWWGCIC